MKMLMTEKSKKKVNAFTPVAPLRMSGEDRRRQLIEAAIKLFSQKGFSGTTTKEIAARTRMSEANIFRHFTGKDALYAAVFEEKAKELQSDTALDEMREFALKRDDEKVFRALMTHILKHYRKNRELLRMVLFGTLEGNELAGKFIEQELKPFRDFLRGYIQIRQSEKVFRLCNVNVVVCAVIAMPSQYAMITGLFGFNELEISDEEAIETFTKMAHNALRVSVQKQIQEI